jgi:hypothetical protein
MTSMVDGPSRSVRQLSDMARITRDARVTFRLTEKLRATIEREADKAGVSVASMMIVLLDEALAARKARRETHG